MGGWRNSIVFLLALIGSLKLTQASTCLEAVQNSVHQDVKYSSAPVGAFGYAKNNAKTSEAGFREADPLQFRVALLQTAGKQWLKIRSIEEYNEIIARGGKLFLTKDSQAGFGISPDHELISLFNNSVLKGLGTQAVKLGINQGATWLRARDGHLRDYYERLGFEVTSRIPSPEAPDRLVMHYRGAPSPVGFAK